MGKPPSFHFFHKNEIEFLTLHQNSYWKHMKSRKHNDILAITYAQPGIVDVHAFQNYRDTADLRLQGRQKRRVPKQH
jgi:hypothetical protein